MKFNNETKVGLLAVMAIGLLILGFNFLKGKSVFKTGNYLFAKYSNTKEITVSNAVFINGFKVGAVYDIDNVDADVKDILVTIKLNDKYRIPKNSIATIKESALSSPTIEIILGDDRQNFLATGDTIHTSNAEGLFSSLSSKIAPVGDQLKETLHSLDSVLKNANSLLDARAKTDIQQSIANVNKATASLLVSSAQIQALLNAQTGALGQTLNNVNSFTKNLADNNQKINRMMSNVEKTTENFAKTDIDGTVASLKNAVEKLNGILEAVNAKDGTIGLLLNDKVLYNNLTNTVRSANILIDDLKVHPKRYVNVSVFGKKDRSTPLKAPLNETTKP